MMLFPLKARQFIWVLAGVEFLTGLFSGAPASGMTSLAHLGGMAGGWVYLFGRGWWLSRQRVGSSGKAPSKGKSGKAGHLRLVSKDGFPEDEGPKTWH